MTSPTSMMNRIPANSDLRPAFTLLELLLVLMLIGISAAAIVPHLNGTIGRWQLRETARNLQTALQAATQWSRVRQETVVLVVDSQKGTFGLRALKNERAAARGLLTIGRQSFGRGVEIAHMEGFQNTGKENILVFEPDGTSSPAMVALIGAGADANRQTIWQIEVDGRGAVQCQERLARETDQ